MFAFLFAREGGRWAPEDPGRQAVDLLYLVGSTVQAVYLSRVSWGMGIAALVFVTALLTFLGRISPASPPLQAFVISIPVFPGKKDNNVKEGHIYLNV